MRALTISTLCFCAMAATAAVAKAGPVAVTDLQFEVHVAEPVRAIQYVIEVRHDPAGDFCQFAVYGDPFHAESRMIELRDLGLDARLNRIAAPANWAKIACFADHDRALQMRDAIRFGGNMLVKIIPVTITEGAATEVGVTTEGVEVQQSGIQQTGIQTGVVESNGTVRGQIGMSLRSAANRPQPNNQPQPTQPGQDRSLEEVETPRPNVQLPEEAQKMLES